ncbi:hypothetical protein H312_00749 [Anncaliia algerae PRA339]|uniref:Uncharacterized protein n=1 Tax=Anncaliia algerae PRA339 TaxID=1288291 RepID=A0A059F3R2_9MICR|nr:hypothetical protein H312_00749 [Anncaliia algerae PRA339]
MFKRGMELRTIKRMLFIMEGEDGFEQRSLRSKMTEVIKNSSREIQDNFYDSGIENKLARDWDSFKKHIEEFCSEKVLLP